MSSTDNYRILPGGKNVYRCKECRFARMGTTRDNWKCTKRDQVIPLNWIPEECPLPKPTGVPPVAVYLVEIPTKAECDGQFRVLQNTVRKYLPGLTDDQVRIVMGLVVDTCPHCYESDKSCRCWDDT